MERLIRDGMKEGKVEQRKAWDGTEYIRFIDSYGHVERGTAIINGKVIWGFPHIKRIFTLENGLAKNMPPYTAYLEEKIDGFNVRIASTNGKIYAFSRGGFVDAFVTEKARELKLERFFSDYPESILCCEMIGNTPYTEPTNDFDTRLYVFDIDEGDGVYLRVDERYRLLTKYKIESVPKLGKFNCKKGKKEYTKLRKLFLNLNNGKREGIVFKSQDRKYVVKYVTPWSDINDIAQASDCFFDMPIGFFYQRVLRSAFAISDFGLDRKKYEQELGNAFYERLVSAINNSKAGKPIAAEFQISITDLRVWEDIKKHMSKEVKLEEISTNIGNDGKTRIRFIKIYKETTKTLTAYANGKGITD